ncbi:MAG: hypothetical protein LC750_08985, partial [Actinobacteria bacterium]|nr:hypothetical protein [Actinomycetota bacterium]
VTEVIYFTSEAEARAGEKKELPPEAAEAMQNYMELAQDTTYLDLPNPWLFTRPTAGSTPA